MEYEDFCKTYALDKMKVIGFNQGQFGDLCINTVACRAFKDAAPNSILHFGINKKYESLRPILEHQKNIDKIHIWDAYNDWPSEEDAKHIISEKFDFVFEAMPKHTSEAWYLKNHQAAEVCLMHKLKPPQNLQVELTKYFDTDRNNKHVAVNLFAETRGNSKTPSIKRSIEICEIIKSKGLIPVQIGLPEQEQICEKRFSGSFFECVKFVLSCDLLITVDSAMSWIASGYSFPTLGLYSYSYYYGAKTSKNWQPINPNGLFLESEHVNKIEDEAILNGISRLL
jgi:ADP-heptose:LPS heptosyltransferase